MMNHVSMLKKYAEEHEIPIKINVYPDVETMLFHITNLEFQIDLVFLDVEIAGFAVVDLLRERNFYGEVIFLTQVEDQWEKAFDVQAFHYVIERNCDQKRFAWIVEKVLQKIEKKHEETLALTCAGKRVVLPIRDIVYFEVKERWITAYYGKESFEFFSRLGKIEETLAGKGFVRVSRFYLVAVRYIASVRYDELTLLNGTKVPIGRGKYQEVRTQFERMEGGR
ncbi:LytR/AlgR family response regulator transcription factor [Hespellia stercorisuis]|uniref:Two component transcriptional regulator, LytTR family n=1 Tax=Hespellia stercorisuis DSM 15480 TaxID=1121950 RepID=A0A1M6W0C6_9FIRM|nr:LytTR family DNA-binding domain-containing protein [Hespellia stercorisuis]SHK87167.1 two component transcriptional regulator, LytTR family [Hespellia stercorisuis DSM 15480]